MSTHSICLCGKIKKKYQHFSDGKSALPVAMSVDPCKTQQNAASDQGLHYLH